MASKQTHGTFNVGAMTRRILRWHDGATDAQVAEGTTWYADAQAFARQLAGETGHDVGQVADVVAVLSPQVSWDVNMRAARDACRIHAAGDRPDVLPGYCGYRTNVAKAWRILDGEADVVRGPKVSAFAAAIRGDLSHVVVDAWAIRAARDPKRALAFAWAEDEQNGIVEKRAIAEAYRRAAALRGIDPAAMQAIVWVAVRSSDAWRKPGNDAERTRFYRKQARARVALGMAPMPGYWQNMGKRAKVAAAIGAA